MVLVDPCDKLIICFLWLLKGGKHNYILFYTLASTDHKVQFLNGFAIFHNPQGTQGVWKIAKKPDHVVKFCSVNGRIIAYFFQKIRYFFSKIRKKYQKN